MLKKYTGVVKKNLNVGGTDCIEVYLPELSPEYPDTAKEPHALPLVLNLPNICEEEEVVFGGEVLTSNNFIAYPAVGTGGQQGSGSVLLPDQGDTVICYHLDGDRSQLYYDLGSKKVESVERSNSTQVNIDDLKTFNWGEGVDPKTMEDDEGDEIASSAEVTHNHRHDTKVVHKTKSFGSLSFSEGLRRGAFLKNVYHHLKMVIDDENDYIEMTTTDEGADAWGLKLDKGEGWVKVHNASGIVFIESDGTDFKVEVKGAGVIKCAEGPLVIDCPDVMFTGNVTIANTLTACSASLLVGAVTVMDDVSVSGSLSAADDVTFTANLTTSGNLHTMGDAKFGGDVIVDLNAQFNQKVLVMEEVEMKKTLMVTEDISSVGGSIHTATTDLDTHTHAGVKPGPSITSIPVPAAFPSVPIMFFVIPPMSGSL